MYILSIDNDDGSFSHAVVKVEWPQLGVADDGGPKRSFFLDYFCHTAALWLTLPVFSASLRVDVSPQRPPVSWHGITASAEDGYLLRQAVAALTRLDGVENALVTGPGGLPDFQKTFAAPVRDWLSLDTEPLTTSAGGEFFCAGRIFDRLPSLLASAVGMGYGLSYQAVFEPRRPHPDLMRRVRKAAAFLERQPAVPRRLVELQHSVCRRLDDAMLLAEEATSIAPAGRAWLDRWLREDASAATASSLAVAPAPVELDADGAEAFAHHVHPDLLVGPPADAVDPAFAARFWTRDEATSLFRCEALWRPNARPGDPPPMSVIFPPPPPPPPPPGAATDPFFFVSYAHKDIGTIRPVLDSIAASGIRLWIDEEIAVGEEWDTRLETMITASLGLLVFLSPSYVASKHCRRELKFADALDKSIFASAFETFPLQSGLGYIFASLQYATGSPQAIVERLIERLRAQLSQGRQTQRANWK